MINFAILGELHDTNKNNHLQRNPSVNDVLIRCNSKLT